MISHPDPRREPLTRALEGVHTLVSVTSAVDGTQRQIQLNLQHAAVRSSCERFAPSQWSFGPTGWETAPATKCTAEGVWEEFLKYKDQIQCTRFNHGSFMHCLGHGSYTTPASPLGDEAQLTRLQEGGGYAKGEDEACEGLQRQGDIRRFWSFPYLVKEWYRRTPSEG